MPCDDDDHDDHHGYDKNDNSEDSVYPEQRSSWPGPEPYCDVRENIRLGLVAMMMIIITMMMIMRTRYGPIEDAPYQARAAWQCQG